jgi:hypothetical protein
MVGEDQFDLGIAEPGKAGILRRRQIEIIGIVDDIGRRIHRMTRVDTDLRVRARQREQHPDYDILTRLGDGRSGQIWQRGEGQKGGAAH